MNGWFLSFYGKFIGKIHKCPMDANGCVNKKIWIPRMISSETTLLAQGNSWSTVCSHNRSLQKIAAAPLSELDVLEKAESAFRKPGRIISRTEGTNSTPTVIFQKNWSSSLRRNELPHTLPQSSLAFSILRYDRLMSLVIKAQNSYSTSSNFQSSSNHHP